MIRRPRLFVLRHCLIGTLLVPVMDLPAAPTAVAQADRTMISSMRSEELNIGIVDVVTGRVRLDPRSEPFTVTLFGQRVFLSLLEPIDCNPNHTNVGAFDMDNRHVELTAPPSLALSVVLARRPVALYLSPSNRVGEHSHDCHAQVLQLLAL